MRQTLEIHIKVELDESTLSSKTTLHVNGQQIGHVSRLRTDTTVDETLPRIEVDMLKGTDLDNLTSDALARVQEHFELLRKLPGVVARMPAPRDG
jgi:hypothetical protein